MRGIRRTRIFALFAGAMLAQAAGAISINSVSCDGPRDVADSKQAAGTIEWDICEAEWGLPTHICQISGQDFSEALGLPAIEIWTHLGAGTAAPQSEGIWRSADPAVWAVLGPPAQSVDFLLAEMTNNDKKPVLGRPESEHKAASRRRYIVWGEPDYNGRISNTAATAGGAFSIGWGGQGIGF